MKNTDYVLYLDLDGVLVDYSSGWWAVARQLGIKDTKKREDSNRVARQTKNPNFWASLGWEYGGEALWNVSNKLFENVHVLTSTAARKENDYHKMVAEGKIEWIADHLEGLSPTNIHIVCDGLLKSKFASKNSILVDDRKSTIDAFNKAGGFGILHDANNYKKTIYELAQITKPMNLGEMAKSLPFVRRQFWNGK